MGSLYFLPYLTKTHIIRKFKAAKKKGKSNEKRKTQDYTFYIAVR